MIQVYSVHAAHGGVGKTSLALALAAELSRHHQNVLFVDMAGPGSVIDRMALCGPKETPAGLHWLSVEETREHLMSGWERQLHRPAPFPFLENYLSRSMPLPSMPLPPSLWRSGTHPALRLLPSCPWERAISSPFYMEPTKPCGRLVREAQGMGFSHLVFDTGVTWSSPVFNTGRLFDQGILELKNFRWKYLMVSPGEWGRAAVGRALSELFRPYPVESVPVITLPDDYNPSNPDCCTVLQGLVRGLL